MTSRDPDPEQVDATANILSDDGRDLGEGTVGLPAIAGDGGDLMTRREVAAKFGVTSQLVGGWARRKPPVLAEVRDAEGRPRYRRAEVEALYASGFRGGRQRRD
jgi:hypothetical protein